jgi:hypothetical protein
VTNSTPSAWTTLIPPGAAWIQHSPDTSDSWDHLEEVDRRRNAPRRLPAGSGAAMCPGHALRRHEFRQAEQPRDTPRSEIAARSIRRAESPESGSQRLRSACRQGPRPSPALHRLRAIATRIFGPTGRSGREVRTGRWRFAEDQIRALKGSGHGRHGLLSCAARFSSWCKSVIAEIPKQPCDCRP